MVGIFAQSSNSNQGIVYVANDPHQPRKHLSKTLSFICIWPPYFMGWAIINVGSNEYHVVISNRFRPNPLKHLKHKSILMFHEQEEGKQLFFTVKFIRMPSRSTLFTCCLSMTNNYQTHIYTKVIKTVYGEVSKVLKLKWSCTHAC